jgi:Ni2+-binding GTPase involved in maturation of urease and hydrogenase
MTKARYIMLGGFLGAGKTTTLIKLAEKLRDGMNQKVGLITNDQAANLVDTNLVKAGNFAVEEIAGGCFCCRFNSLKDAADKLTETERPDVFLAEPVGSCTDLVATVSYPLRRMYGDSFTISPLSVLLDPRRAARIFGLEQGRNFSEKVKYVYLKQVEEAEVLVINKVDSVSPDEIEKLSAYIKENYPKKKLFIMSSRTGEGFDDWADYAISAELGSEECMPIDYDIYADGEALLGWLNATLDVSSAASIDGNDFLKSLAAEFSQAFTSVDKEIAHLKMTLSPEDGSGEIASINQIGSELVPELGLSLLDPLKTGQLVVNIRAEADPEEINTILENVLKKGFASILKLDHVEFFRPGRPTPTHRYAGATG